MLGKKIKSAIMKFTAIFIVMLLLISGCSSREVLPARQIDRAIEQAGKKLERTASSLAPGTYPKASTEEGTWTTESLENSVGWTTGFFPGCLWYMYELTGDESWRQKAEIWTESLEPAKYNTQTHDLGFIFMCSYGNGIRLAKNEGYRDVILTAAKSMSTLYNPNVRAIRNGYWGPWSCPIFIDTMMNTELLFWASENGLDSRYRQMAIDHCLKTAEDLVREDGSTYHCVDYNSVTGEIIRKQTYQGYSDESTWARGQAWALYGYTMAYRYTKDKQMLDFAIKTANYYVDNLPEDGVPYWDFNAPDIPDANRDSSAAAVSASALLELSTFVSDKKLADKYWNTAVKTLKTLCSKEYLANDNESPGILKHAVGFYPENYEVDVSLIYADYYFLEALARYRKLK